MTVKKRGVKSILGEAAMLGVCIIFFIPFIIFSSIRLNQPGKQPYPRFLSL